MPTPKQNQKKLRQLIESVVDVDGKKLTQQRAAEIIAQESMRPCSTRTMRSWLADDDLPSSAKCPDWAVPVLEKGLINIGLLPKK